MAEFAAVVISKVLGSQITDDGAHTLIHCSQSDGKEVWLAVPSEQLVNFVDLFAASASQAESKAGQPKDIKTTFAASWFDLASMDTGSVVLSLTFGAGGTLSFHMPRSMAEQMRETLDVMLGGSGPAAPATPRH